MQAGGSQRAHGGLASGTRTLHADFHALHPVLVARHARGGQRGLLRGVRRTLARSLEADSARGGPAHDAAIRVGDGNLRVVEGSGNVNYPVRHDAAFALLLEFFFAFRRRRFSGCYCRVGGRILLLLFWHDLLHSSKYSTNLSRWKSGSKLPHSKKSLALLAQDLLLRRDRAAPRTLAGARVSVRSLAAHRQVPAVPDPAVGLDFDQPADVHLNLLAEIAFHTAFFFDFLAEMVDFIFRQVANLLRVIDIRLGGELLRALLPDAIDRGQPDPKALLRRKIYTCDTCHSILLKKSLSLTLLVLRVDANHPHHAAAVNHLALVTNLFYRCPYFHNPYSSLAELLVTLHNPAARQIVRRKLHRDFVSRQNQDEILAHLAGNVRQDLVLVFQLNAKHRVRQRLDHRGHDFNGVLLGISGVAFLFFLANRSRHSLPCLLHWFKTRSLQLLPRRPGHFFRSRQNPRPVSGNRHRMLKVRRGAAIRRFGHPLLPHANFRAP